MIAMIWTAAASAAFAAPFFFKPRKPATVTVYAADGHRTKEKVS